VDAVSRRGSGRLMSSSYDQMKSGADGRPVRGDVFDILVTSTEEANLAPIAARRHSLPEYDRQVRKNTRLHWTVASAREIDGLGPFDLSVVVDTGTGSMSAVANLARRHGARREPTILLTPRFSIDIQERMNEALMVAAPWGDAVDSLLTLVHAIVAPVFSDGWVCMDWADVLTVLSDGTNAILSSGKGQTPKEAIADLVENLPFAPRAAWFGACGALSSERGVSMQDYSTFIDVAKSRARPEALGVFGAPVHIGTGAVASMLVITQPSRLLSMRGDLVFPACASHSV